MDSQMTRGIQKLQILTPSTLLIIRYSAMEMYYLELSPNTD